MASTSSRVPLSLILLLGALTAFGPMAVDMYLPAFPQIARELAAPPGTVETTLAAFLLSMGVCQLFYGPVSDRYGRRWPLLAGCGLFILGGVGCAMAVSVEALAGARVLQGIGGAAGVVIARACVRDLFDESQAARMFSRLMLVMGIAPIIAPWIGGQLLLLGSWRAIFVVISAFGTLALVASALILPETLPAERRVEGGMRTAFTNFGLLLGNRPFLGYILAGGFNSGILFGYIAGSPFVFIELFGLAPQHYTYIFGLNSCGIVAAAQVNTWLLRWHTPERLLELALMGNVLTGAGLLGCALTGWGGLPLLGGLLFLSLSSVGIAFPNLAAAALAPHGKMAGSASALLGTMQFLIGGLAGMMVGLLNNGTALAMAGVLAGCAMSGVVALRWLTR